MKEQLTVADYEEVLADHRRLVRELDVLLNGEHGAAKQASLCDIVGQLKRQKCVPSSNPMNRFVKSVGIRTEDRPDGSMTYLIAVHVEQSLEAAKAVRDHISALVTTPVETSSDVSALLTVQQHNKRLRAALSAIAVGTPDLLPPFRIMGEAQLRAMARKALGEVPPVEPTPPLNAAEMGTVARMAAVAAQVQPEKASAPAWDCACNELDCPYCANRNALNGSVPQQPPVDNDHVAPGCEKFDE